jgi:hypothetical protein
MVLSHLVFVNGGLRGFVYEVGHGNNPGRLSSQKKTNCVALTSQNETKSNTPNTSQMNF